MRQEAERDPSMVNLIENTLIAFVTSIGFSIFSKKKQKIFFFKQN